ncbi:hypothetical protein [Sinomicrobium oceani]|nr:hypothetical protein [Sinomicrobium oceani]
MIDFLEREKVVEVLEPKEHYYFSPGNDIFYDGLAYDVYDIKMGVEI